jgi:tetratricopeptide (TPR) repeat protein
MCMMVVGVAFVALAACDDADDAPSPGGAATSPKVQEAQPETASTRPEARPTQPAARDEPAPDPMPALLAQAYRLASQGQLEPARDLAMHYMKGSPDDARAEFLVGMTYHQAGNHAPALPHLERAVKLAPDDRRARRYYAESLFMLGDVEGARREHEAWLDANPDDPVAHYSIGLVDLEEANLDDAASRFRTAIGLFDRMRETDPRRYAAQSAARARCHARLADVHFARDDYEAARDELIESTTIEPRNISAYFTLSVVYRRLGEPELAEDALEHYEAARQAIIDAPSGGDG